MRRSLCLTVVALASLAIGAAAQAPDVATVLRQVGERWNNTTNARRT